MFCYIGGSGGGYICPTGAWRKNLHTSSFTLEHAKLSLAPAAWDKSGQLNQG
jgi:hypothetical protein